MAFKKASLQKGNNKKAKENELMEDPKDKKMREAGTSLYPTDPMDVKVTLPPKKKLMKVGPGSKKANKSVSRDLKANKKKGDAPFYTA